ncbi:hypothetical protein ACM66B_005652 [Microbotryomycetes sp. NB124-2]
MALVTTANSKTAKRLACALALEFLDLHVDFFKDHCDCAIIRAQKQADEAARVDAEGNDGDSEDEAASINGSDDDEPQRKKRKVDRGPIEAVEIPEVQEEQPSCQEQSTSDLASMNAQVTTLEMTNDPTDKTLQAVDVVMTQVEGRATAT